MAKTISFTIKLDGSKEVLGQIDKIGKALTDKLKNASVNIDSKAFDELKRSTDDLKKNVSQAGELISSMTKRLTELRGEGKQNTVEYQNLTRQVAELKNQQAKTNEEVKKSQVQLEASTNLQKLLTGEIKTSELTQKKFFEAINSGLDEADPRYQELINDFVRLKQEEKEFRDGLKIQQRILEQGSDVAGRYRRLNAELVNANAALKDLTDEEIESGVISDRLRQKYGLTANTVAELTRRQNELDTELKETDASMGNFQRSVGNYEKALSGLPDILQNIGGNFGGAVGGIGSFAGNLKALVTGGGIAAAVAAIGELVNAGSEALGLADEFIKLEGELGNLTGLQGPQLQDFTIRVNALAKVEGFQVDDTEIAQAANTLAQQLTGGDFNKALDLIQTGLQGGLNISGDFLDRIKEYAPQLKEAGQSAEQLLETISLEVKTGVFSDKGIDSIKEATERIGRLEAAALDGLDQLGLSSTQIQSDLESGATTVDAVIKQASDAISKLPENSTIARQAIEKIFGTPGVDAGRKFIDQLKDIDGNIEEVADESTRLFKIQQQQIEAEEDLAEATAELSKVAGGVGASFGTLGTNIQAFFLRALTALIKFISALREVPKFIKENRVEIIALGVALATLNAQAIAAAVNTLRQAAAARAVTIATKAQAVAQRILNAAMTANPIGLVIAAVAGLVAIFTRLYKSSQTLRSGIAGTFSALKNIVGNVVGGIVKQLTGFGQILKGVFTLDLDDIKQGAKKYAEGVGDVFLRAGEGVGDAFAKGFSEKTARDLNSAIDKAIEDGGDQLADSVNEQIAKALEKGQITNAQADAFQDRLQKGIEGEIEPDININAGGAGASAADDFLDSFEGETIDGLKETLKKLNEQLDKTPIGTAAFKSIQSQIARVQKQIEGASAKANKKIVEDRKKALDNIRKLESGIIKNEFDAKEVQATGGAEADIAGLVGDPEQIRKQTTLIKSQLALSLSEIEQSRVSSFAAVIEKAKQSAANEIALLTGSPNEIAINSEIIKQALAVQIEGITAGRDAAINKAISDAEANKEKEIAALAGSPEEIEANAVIIRETYTRAINDLTEKRKAVITEDEIEINTLRKEIIKQYGGELNSELQSASLIELQTAKTALDSRLALLDEELARKKTALIDFAALERQRLALELESGVSPSRAQAIADELEAIDKKLKADLLKSEQDLAAARLKAVKEIVPKTLTEAEKLAQAEIAINQEKNDAIIAANKARVDKQKELEKQIKDELISGAFEIAGAFGDAFVEGEKRKIDEQIKIQREQITSSAEASKDSTKAFYEAQIQEAEGNTARQEELRNELAAKLVEIDERTAANERRIDKRNAIEQQKIARKQAIINGALAVTRALAFGNAAQAIAAGLAVAVQLITISSQKFEKGGALTEAAERYIIDAYEYGGTVQAPDITKASANIPREGLIKGRSHNRGGVPASFNNTAIEVEGNEYKLQNGKETYIINRKSTKLFRRELDSLKGNPTLFNPAKREAASRINARRGFGVKFATGGALGVSSIPAIPAPVRLQDVGSGVSREELANAVGVMYVSLQDIARNVDRKTDTIATELQRETAAVNNRIDRMIVYTDPVDIVNKGNERKKAQTAGEL